ncbi:hypothetical protein LXL04_016948 [Taraxacum kok-saghyz]
MTLLAGTTIEYMRPMVFFAAAVIGVLTGVDDFLYACGVSRLPVSTTSLIIASQLGFTAFFAFLLVKQKFTPYSIMALYGLVLSMVEMTYNKTKQAITYTLVTNSGQKSHMRTILKSSWVKSVTSEFSVKFLMCTLTADSQRYTYTDGHMTWKRQPWKTFDVQREPIDRAAIEEARVEI